MKRIISVVAFAVLIVAFAAVAHARVIDYTEDSENFPNMLTEHETCSQAYEKFLNTAQPLNACHHLEEARANLEAEQKVKQQMGTMQNCRNCSKMMVQADEAIAAYQEQIKLYGGQCPSEKQQAKLTKDLPKRQREVCQDCQNKWPGTLGPTESNPCR